MYLYLNTLFQILHKEMKKLLSILLTLQLLASCSQEELGTLFYAGQKVSISAALSSSNNNDGKKRISGKDNVDRINLTWDEGDKILVTVGDKSAVFTLSSGAGTNNAIFSGTMPADGSNFHVSYPIDYTDEVLTNQTYVANGFGKGLMKMSTKIPGTLDDGFMLSADNALLGLKLQGDANVSKIVLTQKDNDDNAENDKTYTLDCSTQVVNTADGALFYIVVPAGTWGNGLKVEVYNGNGIMIEERTKTSAAEFVAGQALMMPEVEVHDILTFEVNGVKFNMVYVEGGTFMMGAAENEPDAHENERPQHKVTLSDFYIGQIEVSQALWQTVMGSNPSTVKDNNRPVNNVTWEECQVFVEKLSEKTGYYFRLPTEAEWEYAARGGQKSRGYLYAGSNNINEVAWYAGNSSGITHAFATKQPNELGIYDMSGNVWEWCNDWCGLYSAEAQVGPTGPETGEHHMYRGGGYRYLAKDCRVARRRQTASYSKESLGLRLALDMHDYVDLGLSVKWATCNVGANNAEDYGYYFAWGETEPKENYDWNVYKWCDGTEQNMTKYNTSDRLITLLSEDDAAHVNWGGKWRMPSDAEWVELRESCVWDWTTMNNVKGYRVTGMTGNSIFLPETGYRILTSLHSGTAYYWTNTLNTSSSNKAEGVYFNSERKGKDKYLRRCGFPIRPVLPKE